MSAEKERLAKQESMCTHRLRVRKDCLTRQQRWGLGVIRLYLDGERGSFTPIYPEDPGPGKFRGGKRRG